MAGFDEVPFELIAEHNHFCNLIANQQNAAISICRQVYLQGSQLFFMIVSIFFSNVCLTSVIHTVFPHTVSAETILF